MAKEIQTATVEVVNLSNGPRGVNTIGGLVIVGSGQTSAKLELSEGEVKSLQEGGNFSIKSREDGRVITLNTPDLRPSRVMQALNRLDALEQRVAELEANRGGSAPVNSTKESKEPAKVDREKVLRILEMKDNNFTEFKAAASTVLAKVPSKKEDIVTALEELATQ